MIDRAVSACDRTLWEVPVGFKWFAPGSVRRLLLLRRRRERGRQFPAARWEVWTTDKDGLILGLLSAEITARTGKDPGEHYRDLTSRFGQSFYTRIDAPATLEQKTALSKLSPSAVTAADLAGDADHIEDYRRAWQQSPDRRPEGDDEQRMVRGASFRN